MAVTTALNPVIRQELDTNGFLSVDQLIDSTCLNTLRDLYDKMLSKEIDCGEDDRLLGGLTRQIMFPSKHHDFFKANQAIENAKAILGDYYGKEMVMNWDMMISKQPGNTNPTPWHQDFAYSAMPYAEAGLPCDNDSLMIWLPMDDVDEENGCMHFLIGKHTQGLFPHYIFSGSPEDEGRLLASEELKAIGGDAVACPIPAGGCTMHFNGTPHYTTGNFSENRERRAYIFNLSAVSA